MELNSTALKIEQTIDQPIAESIPHACAQPYHGGSGGHRKLFRPYWGPPAWQTCWLHEPLTAKVSAKQSVKRQLHTTHVGAVGWEPHSSSTLTCVGKVDHELPVN